MGSEEIAIACADCPGCGEQNVVGRVPSLGTSLESRREHDVRCRKCGRCFKLAEFDLRVRAKKREAIEAVCSVESLPLIS
jgi:hypothetical protein